MNLRVIACEADVCDAHACGMKHDTRRRSQHVDVNADLPDDGIPPHGLPVQFRGHPIRVVHGQVQIIHHWENVKLGQEEG